ncbi:MAG: hypothetical protein D6739_05410, partial [Nitrospirae bacterium]
MPRTRPTAFPRDPREPARRRARLGLSLTVSAALHGTSLIAVSVLGPRACPAPEWQPEPTRALELTLATPPPEEAAFLAEAD